MAPGSERLPRNARLRARGQFLRVQDRGRRFQSRSLVLLLLANDLGTRRLGVTVSTKVGNSVTRSRIKRRLRELFRKRRDGLPPSHDVVLVARGAAATAAFSDLARDFDQLASAAARRGQR